MAELQITKEEAVGIMKEIDSGAIDLVFNALQEDIYAKPIPSFVRETISNAIDAIVERDAALDIIQNDAPISKYYRDATDDELLKDSGWNPDYYNPEFLSDDRYVHVEYKESNPRDVISITDYGVGLGGSRLRGWFSLGFSTKRNMKSVFGKWGMGAKSGLATGVEYFVLHTTYNGYTTSFMVYRRDYDPITPKSERSKVEVWKVKMADGSTVNKEIYWEPTKSKNSVTIELPVKHHNKRAFIDAVEKQFEYVKDRIKFTQPTLLYSRGGSMRIDIISPSVLYESENLIIISNSIYRDPHIVIDGINYGPISWEELELENRTGSIGIKVSANDVDVTHSRESVKYTDKTKNTILKAIERTKEEVVERVLELSKQDSSMTTFKAIKDAADIANASIGISDSVLKVMLRFLGSTEDIKTVSLKVDDKDTYRNFTLDTVLWSSLSKYFVLKEVTVSVSGSKVFLKSVPIFNRWDILRNKLVYAEEKPLSKNKAIHIADKYNISTFLYVRPATKPGATVSEDLDYIANAILEELPEEADIDLDTYNFPSEVDFSDENDTSEVSESSVVDKPRVNYAKLRKLQQKVLVNTLIFKDSKYSYSYSLDLYAPHHLQEEPKISDIPSLYDDNTYYVTSEDKYLAMMFLYINMRSPQLLKDKRKIIYISKSIVKHFSTVKPFTQSFHTYDKETKTMALSDYIIAYNTKVKLKEILSKDFKIPSSLAILKSLDYIDANKYDHYNNISNTSLEDYLRDKLKSSDFTSLMTYLQNTRDLQDFITSGDHTLEEIKLKSKSLFGAEIINIEAYDEEFISTVQKYVKLTEPNRDLFRHLSVSRYAEEEEKDNIRNSINFLLLSAENNTFTNTKTNSINQ